MRGSINNDSPRHLPTDIAMILKPLTISIVVACATATQAAERIVDLSKIVSTSNQRGLIQARPSYRDDGIFEQSFGYHLQKIVRASESGASNLFLVDATNIDDAVRASTEVLLGGRGVSVPASADSRKQRNGRHWLVAYLGVGPSSPPAWTIKAVSINGNRIKIAYQIPQPTTVTSDVHAYYYWIPLGKLGANVYELELFDVNLKEVTLLRRVEVSQ